MAKSTLTSFDFGDVLHYAAANGTPWNAVHALFEAADIVPMVDQPYMDIDISDCTHPERAYGWSQEVCDILKGFMASENITEFRMQS